MILDRVKKIWTRENDSRLDKRLWTRQKSSPPLLSIMAFYDSALNWPFESAKRMIDGSVKCNRWASEFSLLSGPE